jgi:DNA-binding NarL/FixJ family response regulator
MGVPHDKRARTVSMPTLFIARRDVSRARQAQAQLEASREWQVLGVAESQYRARMALSRLDPDALLIDLRLEDGVALSLVRELRERRAERPKVMLLAVDVSDPFLFPSLLAGGDAYVLEHDLPVAAAALTRLLAGEAAIAAPLAAEALKFFGEAFKPPSANTLPEDRALDWRSNGTNPMKLSPGERRLLQLLAQGARAGEVAARMAISLEAVGRRVGNIYRKLSWDVRSGSLVLLAA